MKKAMLTIFLPSGICWEISTRHIRTRHTATQRVIMRAHTFPGSWVQWLTTAHNLTHERTLYLSKVAA